MLQICHWSIFVNDVTLFLAFVDDIPFAQILCVDFLSVIFVMQCLFFFIFSRFPNPNGLPARHYSKV